MTHTPSVETKFFSFAEGAERFRLASGEELGPVRLAYESYGELAPRKDNAILLIHALTGNQHAAGFNASIPDLGERWTEDVHVGWWDDFIGPGKALDTDRYCVLCVNYVGGCYGSTGPISVDPASGKPWGRSFPRVTFADAVRAQVHLLDHLGIERLHATVGPSTGGMACINFATLFPERVERVILVATGMSPTPLHLIHNYEQIRAIETDVAYRGGDYYPGPGPVEGMALARMISHKTFVSLHWLEERSESRVRVPGETEGTWYGVTHPLESYMLHQGLKFAQRFDANSYLRILDAWSHFDPLADAGVDTPAELFARCKGQRYLLFSINSDVCYYPDEQEVIGAALKEARVECVHVTVHSYKGHDAFLLEPALFAPHIRHVLDES